MSEKQWLSSGDSNASTSGFAAAPLALQWCEPEQKTYEHRNIRNITLLSTFPVNLANLINDVAKACICGKLPDVAIEWPIITISHNSVIYGSGESSQFGTSQTLRVNGKQIQRKHSQWCEYAQVDKPERLALAARKGKLDIYVQWPEFIPTAPQPPNPNSPPEGVAEGL